MKTCPYCQSRIDSRALKCPHCQSAFDGAQMDAGRREHNRANLGKVLALIVGGAIVLYAAASPADKAGLRGAFNFDARP